MPNSARTRRHAAIVPCRRGTAARLVDQHRGAAAAGRGTACTQNSPTRISSRPAGQHGDQRRAEERAEHRDAPAGQQRAAQHRGRGTRAAASPAPDGRPWTGSPRRCGRSPSAPPRRPAGPTARGRRRWCGRPARPTARPRAALAPGRQHPAAERGAAVETGEQQRHDARVTSSSGETIAADLAPCRRPRPRAAGRGTPRPGSGRPSRRRRCSSWPA